MSDALSANSASDSDVPDISMQGKARLMSRSICCLLICGLLWGCGQSEDINTASLDHAVDGLSGQVSVMVRDHAMSGVVLVALQGEPILEQAFNVDSLRADFEVTANTAFAIASITKSFTATLVLSQVESGRIDLDAPVSAYLPGLNATYADDVTVRQLLENRSGIPHYVDIPGWFEPTVKNEFTAESFLAERLESHTVLLGDLAPAL